MFIWQHITSSSGSTSPAPAAHQVPLDGIIVYGSAQVSAKHITGESMPFAVAPGRQVPAGALNHDGLLVVRTTHVAADSTPARIARLTSSAQASRPQLRRWLDRFGEGYSKVRLFFSRVAVLLLLVVVAKASLSACTDTHVPPILLAYSAFAGMHALLLNVSCGSPVS